MKKYHIEPFFQNILDKNIFLGMKPKNTYNDFPNLFRQYREKLAEVKRRPIYTTGEGQIYGRVIELNLGGYYTSAWDICKANELINHLNLPLQTAPIKDIMQFVDAASLTPSYFPTALKNHNPAILVYFSPLHTYYVIDGNHRIAARFNKNPYQSFPFFVIPHPIHMSVMFSDSDRALYAIHQNLTTILNYMLGNWESLDLARERGCVRSTEDLMWL